MLIRTWRGILTGPLQMKKLRHTKIIHMYSMLNNVSPKDISVLIPGLYDYVTLHGKIDFAEVIK